MNQGHPVHKIRIHGDYHLGQTLKTEEGFALIDFEGEPARAVAERRGKQCALKDVAGLTRSLEYAVETVRARDESARIADLSSNRLRSAFLEGYQTRAAAVCAVFVPGDPPAVTAWLEFFELERALYELEYELNNRPAWVYIPLRGVVRLLAAGEA